MSIRITVTHGTIIITVTRTRGDPVELRLAGAFIGTIHQRLGAAHFFIQVALKINGARNIPVTGLMSTA